MSSPTRDYAAPDVLARLGASGVSATVTWGRLHRTAGSRNPLAVRPLPLALATLLLAVACSVNVPPRPASADDPSNPRAPTEPFDPPANTVANEVVAKEDKPAASNTVYACPMNHVVRDVPGVCPVCGMTLEPRPRGK